MTADIASGSSLPGDVGDRAVAIDDDIDRKGVGAPEVLGKCQIVRGLFEADAVGDAEIFGKPLHAAEVVGGLLAANAAAAARD